MQASLRRRVLTTHFAANRLTILANSSLVAIGNVEIRSSARIRLYLAPTLCTIHYCCPIRLSFRLHPSSLPLSYHAWLDLLHCIVLPLDNHDVLILKLPRPALACRVDRSAAGSGTWIGCLLLEVGVTSAKSECCGISTNGADGGSSVLHRNDQLFNVLSLVFAEKRRSTPI